MAKFTSKPAIRDSFDEEEASDDVDDEVFIRDGRNGYKMDEESGVKKPLMPLRRRQKSSKFSPNVTTEPRKKCKMFIVPCCYGLAALSVLLGLFALSVVAFNYLSLPMSRIQFWMVKKSQPSEEKLIPCTELAVTDVWIQSFSKLTSETAIRLSDVNHDGILDVILGYGTGTDGRNVPDFVCTLYFGRDPPCLGGIVALDGRSGNIVWQHWTRRPVFSVDCSADLTNDGVNDCLIGGKGGLLHVVNGHDGSLLWHLEEQLVSEQTEVVLDVYSAQFIPDIDEDGFVDVLAAHTMSDLPGNAVKGHLIIVSGKVGHMLRMIEMPGSSESYYAPQLLEHPDGERVILIGTGGTASHSWGGLHAVPMSELAGTDKVPFQTLVSSDSRGVMSPPVLVDINLDGSEDIVVSLFNSTVVAIDGKTYQTLWNYTFSNSQTFSPPTPGYYNDDDIPDFLVKYQNGHDFPAYFYSQMNILDGKTGLPLLDHPIVDSVGSQMGGLSLSVEGKGNDWFLYWTANCIGHEGSQTPFTFAKGSDIVSQSQADICHLRFNSSMVATLHAINQHVDGPGFPLYSSDKRESIEYNNTKKSWDEAAEYLASHPDFWSMFGAQEKTGKSSNIGNLQTDGIKLADRRPSPFETVVEDQFKAMTPSRSGNVKGGEAEELEEPDFSHMQAHHVGKHQRPFAVSDPISDWRLGDSSKNYGALYEPRTSDNVDQDYEAPIMKDADMPSARLSNVLNSYLGDSGSEQESPQQTLPNFANVFSNHRRSGSRRLKRFLSQNHLFRHSMRDSISKEKRGVIDDLSEGKSVNDGVKNSSNTLTVTAKGIYPITSTGTFAPALSGSGIDLIMLSYWIPPSDGVQILTAKDVECIKQGMARASNDESDKYANMDQDTVESAVTAECLYQHYSSVSNQESAVPQDGRMEPHPGIMPKVAGGISSSYRALNLQLGQLTVYRVNLQCKCDNLNGKSGTCSRIIPFHQQSWPSYMGLNGKGYFNSRKHFLWPN